MMRSFDTHPFDIDFTDHLQIGSIPPFTLYQLFKNARVSGNLIEHIVHHCVKGLTIEKGQQSYDLFDARSRKLYECKSSGSPAWNINPSYMKGTKRNQGEERQTNAVRLEEWIASIDGIILCHTAKFPLLEFATLVLPDDKTLLHFTKSATTVSKTVWDTLRERSPVRKYKP